MILVLNAGILAVAPSFTVKTFTIDHTLLGTSDVTNFIVPVTGTFTWAKSVANSGLVNLTSGNPYDCQWFSDFACTVPLNFERVVHNVTTGKIEYHVEIPTLTHATNPVIYCKVGDVTATTDESSNAAWPSQWKGVFHFGDGATLSVADSTSNGNNLTNHGAVAAAGKLSGAAQFDGSSTYMEHAANVAGFEWDTMRSLEFLMFASTDSQTLARIIAGKNWNVVWNEPAEGTGFNSTISARGAGMSDGDTTQPDHSANSGAWHQVQIDGDGAGGVTAIYIDGVSQTLSAEGGQSIAYTGGLILGQRGDGARWFNGLLDEVRASTSALGSSWATAMSAAMLNASSFFTVT